jgi:hypothetical protein
VSNAEFDGERFNLKRLMLWKLRNTFRSKSQIGLQFWKIWTLRRVEKALKNIKTSAKESLDHYELKQHKPLMKNAQNY